MTPEEILRDLRDIHLPEEAADAAGVGLVLWPAALVIILALIGCWLAWRRRAVWRRDVTSHLLRIERDVDDGRIMQGWEELARLLRRLALSTDDRREVAGLIGDAWLERLDRLLVTDAFSKGPGRGVAVFPYQGAITDDRKEQARIADELKATIDIVRNRLPRLRAAP